MIRKNNPLEKVDLGKKNWDVELPYKHIKTF